MTDLFDPTWLAGLSPLVPKDFDAGSATAQVDTDHACHGWAPLVARWLGTLFDGEPDVLCLDDSQDVKAATATPLWDFCVVVQLSGRTTWRLDSGLVKPGGVKSAVTNVGDLVLVSGSLPYRAAVPDAFPCRRALFAFCRRPLGY